MPWYCNLLCRCRRGSDLFATTGARYGPWFAQIACSISILTRLPSNFPRVRGFESRILLLKAFMSARLAMPANDAVPRIKIRGFICGLNTVGRGCSQLHQRIARETFTAVQGRGLPWRRAQTSAAWHGMAGLLMAAPNRALAAACIPPLLLPLRVGG